ncbi:MAG TPA: alpha-2-macroglobulin family protein [Armatimonadota bacterium]|nr:alpha-2-macroglobulin family protein [Armatimonadota bacterium]
MTKRILAMLRRPQVGPALVALAMISTAVAVGPREMRADTGISPLETRILGQSQWLAGSTASLRVIVSDHDTGKPLRAWVRVAARPQPKGDEQPAALTILHERRTDRSGTLDAGFRVPAFEPGQYELVVEVGAGTAGTDLVKQPLRITKRAEVLLTTDKPIYQPGQVIHLRALALMKPQRLPVAGEKVIFEIEDAKGNKVFKQGVELSRFGVAGADFQLASELNLGRWRARAVLPFGSAEKTIAVERYVLPKFKIVITPDKSFYLPGEIATGKLQADYIFGKPVAGGEVLITASTFDIGWTEIGEIHGRTDDNGTYRYSIELPKTFVGQPLEQGKALAKLDVEVTDRADHSEHAAKTMPVAQDPISIVAIPESKTLRPGLPNTVYLITAYPDGTPARCRLSVTVTGAARSATTDDLGIADLSFTPTGGVSLTVVADDGKGNKAERTIPLGVQPGADAIILRADAAIARAGDKLDVTVLCTRQTGTVYLDAVRDGQTILTKSLDLSGGKATMSLPITPDMIGTVELHAYKILPDENIIRDTRLIYVKPADDLRIGITTDKQTYRPRGKARVEFTVTDQQNHPVLAALGVVVVDEAVYALQEMQPGLAEIYFTLERELMEPRYEIHGLRPASVVRGELPIPEADRAGLQQKAARVLFAAVERPERFSLSVNTYTERVAKMREQWMQAMSRDAERINRALEQYRQRHGRYLDPNADIAVLVQEGLLRRSDLRDQWGNPYRVRFRAANAWLESAGPDGRWDTVDDLRAAEMLGRFRGGAVESEQMPAMPQEGLFFGRREAAAAPAAMAKDARREVGDAAAPEPVMVRQFFPETMFFDPQIITDERGRATLDLDMADSITTWRMSTMASSMRGQLGSRDLPLRVFQDFFIDIDLPVALTQNDEVSIPVAIYNYLKRPQEIKLELERGAWFELLGDAAKTVTIKAEDVGVTYFRLRVKQIGNHRLTVTARGSEMSDAMQRQIEVVPDGKEVREVVNDRIDADVRRTVVIPAEALPDASNLLVKIYPGVFSQAVEGLDAMLRMPFGCFEQTSSVTYPNVLVLDYLKTTGKVSPELQMKAEGFIGVGYQRLVSYEVAGGGFSWFGNAPAHQVLTAYGLLEFSDMARVHEVDANVIRRTQEWLAGRQQADGTWPLDKGGIAEGIINRQTDVFRTTAYITWALAESGYQGPALSKGLDYVRAHYAKEKDPYALAVVANAFLTIDPNDPDGKTAIDMLAELAVEQDKVAYWKGAGRTFTGATDQGADLETTALAAYAVVKSGRHVGLTNKAMNYLVQAKDSFGTWQTTQATVWALKAMLAAMGKATQEIDAKLTVSINGKQAAKFAITPEDYDVMRQVDLKGLAQAGKNEVTITFSGKGSALYQIVSIYYLPWQRVQQPPKEVLGIQVSYDKTRLAQNDTATCSVKVTNNTGKVAEMVIIDLGVPPGFEVMPEDLQRMVDKGVFQKFTLAARQIIIYIEEIKPGAPLEFSYTLRAKFPIKAKTPQSRVYKYYNPEVVGIARPVEMAIEG